MENHKQIFEDLLSMNFIYIIIETKWTIHHIERTTYSDRGKIKWIAETKSDAYEAMKDDEEARMSSIDHCDLFPRLYFLATSFVNEFGAWLDARGLQPTSIKHGEI
jgi:hypothetical protein